MSFYPDDFCLESFGTSLAAGRLVYDRAKFQEHGSIQAGFMTGVIVFLRAPKRLILRFPGEASQSLRRWIAPMRKQCMVQAFRKGRFTMILLGILFVFSSLGLFRDSQFNPFSLLFGAGLLGLAVVEALRPHHALFVVEACFWLAFSLILLRGIILQFSWFGLVIVLLAAAAATSRFALFRFFKPIQKA